MTGWVMPATLGGTLAGTTGSGEPSGPTGTALGGGKAGGGGWPPAIGDTGSVKSGKNTAVETGVNVSATADSVVFWLVV
jgi:hypothetical protein